jgi:tetratricopeptide (TPR) repeat protein
MSWYLVKSLASSPRLQILSVAFLCGVAGSAAHAQPTPAPATPTVAPATPPPPAPNGKDAGKDAKDGDKDAKDTAAAEQRARAHFQRGQELANQGKYPQAYLEFEAGYRQSHRPLFLFNLGEAARAFGDAGRARGAYQRYLEEDPSGPMVSSAQARLTDLGPGPATDLGLSKKNEGKDQPVPQTSPLLLPPERFTTAEPKVQPSSPLWKKWPFWAAVGGVVVGGVAVYAFTRDTSACGDGCTLIDLR